MRTSLGPVATGATSAPAPNHPTRRVTLDDVYGPGEGGGRALMSGIQAIVRFLIEQRRLDERRELDTAAFVSGYEGSPLGGLDLELAHARRAIDEATVVFRPGLNEELAATAVAGTQLVGQVPGHQHDGVVGVWYGKNPGLDRAADAIRHANYAGTSPLGGAVALIGDDPTCKSSTLPSSSVEMARSLHLPLLSAGSVADVVRLGLHAVAMSRASGLWSGLQIVADVADASAVVDLGAAWAEIPEPDPDRAFETRLLVGPKALSAEAELFARRLPAVAAYVRAAGLNAVTMDSPGAALGVVASGYTYATVVRALADLGLDEAACAALGLCLVRLDLVWPLEASEVRRLVAGLDEVVVIEDKAPFIESQIKAALYGQAHQPAVWGKTGPDGAALVPVTGSVEADTVSAVLGRRIGDRHDQAGGPALPASARRRLEALAPPRREHLTLHVAPVPQRSAAFCSGCPHNLSTREADDQLVGLGIGCHIMAGFDAHGRGHQVGMTQMGGEGAQWTGMAPFAPGQHYVQNIGDGTFFHSGSLAVRAAVAAGVDITYKLLYNDAVAMTGGQRPQGQMGVAELTRLLATEGVGRVIVTTPEPQHYQGVTLDPIAEVRHRDRLAESMAELKALGGVTVLIHDDACAAEQRRLRRRGKLATPPRRIWINPRVCEGCGDCGEKSSCLSVVPIETEFGRKTMIHQGSCNFDYSCTTGDCPSFVEVVPAGAGRPGDGTKAVPGDDEHGLRRRTRRNTAHRRVPEPPVRLVEPDRRRVPDEVLVRMPGIGGTGVVTVSRLLQMAAHLDGRYAAGLDQTGLAQKGGPVTSDVRISPRPIVGAVRAGARAADLLLGLDMLGAEHEDNLAVCEAGRTVAVVNTAKVATAAMVRDPSLAFPRDLARIERATRRPDNYYLDAQWIAERLFGDHLPTNLVLLGAAYQRGCLPVSAGAIDEAIRLNGAGSAENRAAFAWGRAAVIDHDTVVAALSPAAPAPPKAPVTLRRLLASAPTPLADRLRLGVADLADYQHTRYARHYLEAVLEVARIEHEATADAAYPVSAAYAQGLHKLMAYKDEYEVARLHLDPAQKAALAAEFGAGATTRVLLHPPVLKAMGLDHKISLGPWTRPAFVALRAGRRLRGTPLDIFGRTELRRTERSLIDEYRAVVAEALTHLAPETAATVTALAGAAQAIRGYEDVKRRNIERFRLHTSELLATLRQAVSGPSASGDSGQSPAGVATGPWPIAG